MFLFNVLHDYSEINIRLSKLVILILERFMNSKKCSLFSFRYDDENDDKVGIIRLLSNGVFAAAYPLHDGLAVKDDSSGSRCSRRVSLKNFNVANFHFFEYQSLCLENLARLH